jgi:hypothetical protein
MINFGVIQFILALFGAIISTWWLWIPIAGALGYFAWQNFRRTRWAINTEYQLLLLEIPRTNEKKELAAEQLFSSLHGILRPKKELSREGSIQEHISFEIASIDQRIRFYVWTPKHLQHFIEGQIYAQYPDVQIKEMTEDYTGRTLTQPVFHSVELTLNTSDVLPIRTFPSFEVDPLAGLTATLSKIEEKGEEIWLQILAKPIDDHWHKRGAAVIKSIKNGSGGGLGAVASGFGKYTLQALKALITPPEATDSKRELSERERSQISAIEEKSAKLGYETIVRLAYVGQDESTARVRLQSLVGTFKQFNSTNLNGFRVKSSSFDKEVQKRFRSRYLKSGEMTMNTEEMASIWHLPHTNVETPNIHWAHTRVGEPPSNLPTLENEEETALSLFGSTNFRGSHMQFGLKRTDRSRHMYIIGQTGTGKSGLLQLLTLSDIYHNQGFAVIDPHGDYAHNTMRYIPQSRLKDVVYFNPADTEFPMSFNPLEVSDPKLKGHITSELVGVLKRMFDSWGPRLEYILRYTIMALLDYPNSTMLDITRMLTEKSFRKEVIDMIQDPVVRNFWVTEFGSWDARFANEAVAPVLNKVGAFTANPMIRNIIGQPKSTFNIRQIMDERKILLVNLSRGLMGEDNAAILGALMVTKIQLAAMSRADMSEQGRTPFYLYVDEFQNFATDSFSVILSEARKYGLNLTVANQYINQMIPEVRDAIFGNVGSVVAFRVGADDSRVLEKYFEPNFMASDLMNMSNRHFVATLNIEGERTHSFSATTLTIPPASQDITPTIVEHSRQTYAEHVEVVEKRIAEIAAKKGSPTPVSPQNNRGHNSKGKDKKHHNTNRGRSRGSDNSSQSAQPQKKSKSNGSLQQDEVISLR